MGPQAKPPVWGLLPTRLPHKTQPRNRQRQRQDVTALNTRPFIRYKLFFERDHYVLSSPSLLHIISDDPTTIGCLQTRCSAAPVAPFTEQAESRDCRLASSSGRPLHILWSAELPSRSESYLYNHRLAEVHTTIQVSPALLSYAASAQRRSPHTPNSRYPHMYRIGRRQIIARPAISVGSSSSDDLPCFFSSSSSLHSSAFTNSAMSLRR